MSYGKRGIAGACHLPGITRCIRPSPESGPVIGGRPLAFVCRAPSVVCESDLGHPSTRPSFVRRPCVVRSFVHCLWCVRRLCIVRASVVRASSVCRSCVVDLSFVVRHSCIICVSSVRRLCVVLPLEEGAREVYQPSTWHKRRDHSYGCAMKPAEN